MRHHGSYARKIQQAKCATRSGHRGISGGKRKAAIKWGDRATRPRFTSREAHHISTAEVKARQLARLDPEEAQTLARLHADALARTTAAKRVCRVIAPICERSPFERLSVSKDYDLYTEALRHGRGRIELSDLKAELTTDRHGRDAHRRRRGRDERESGT